MIPQRVQVRGFLSYREEQEVRSVRPSPRFGAGTTVPFAERSSEVDAAQRASLAELAQSLRGLQSVVEVRGDGKVKLSKVAAEKAEERAEAEAYMRSSAPAQGKGFGTLGDLLKDKLNK